MPAVSLHELLNLSAAAACQYEQQVEAITLKATAVHSLLCVRTLPSYLSVGICEAFGCASTALYLLYHRAPATAACRLELHQLGQLAGEIVSRHSQPQAAITPADPSAADESTSTKSDSLLCTATALSHMAESRLRTGSPGPTQSSSHSQASQSATQLGLLLSLLVYIAGLCPK